jgi:PKD repeat protein
MDITLDEDTLIVFNGSGSYDPEGGSIVWYNWSFGDGNYKFGSDFAPNHTYSIPGVYIVTLNVTDGRGGNSNEATIQITVNDTTSPMADAGADDSVDEDSQYNFDSSGSLDYEGLNLTQFLWDFDIYDGVNWLTPDSTSANPQHIYATPGTYYATLRVIDSGGNWDEDIIKITVLDVTPPFADAGIDDFGHEDSNFFFDASGSFDYESGTISSYAWDMDQSDGLNWILPDQVGVSPSHIFIVPGIYTVTLNVTDSNGNWEMDTVSITVMDLTNPIADAGSDDIAILGKPYTFNASDSDDPQGGMIVSYKWDLNASDGIDWSIPDYEGVSLDYIFTELGTYIVTMRVEDAHGNFDFDTVTITVIPADYIPPDTPGNLRVEANPQGRALEIKWDANTEPDLDYYIIYFSTDNENFTELAEVPAGTNIYSHTKLTNGVTYSYYIVAFDTKNNPSESSGIVNAVPNVDTDLDGIPNVIDPDDDNDGLSDEEEAKIGTNPMDTDTDSDGHDDKEDIHPLDPKRWKVREEGIQLWLWLIMIIIVIVILVLILVLTKRKKEEIEIPPSEEKPQKELPPPPPWMKEKKSSEEDDVPEDELPPPDDEDFAGSDNELPPSDDGDLPYPEDDEISEDDLPPPDD